MTSPGGDGVEREVGAVEAGSFATIGFLLGSATVGLLFRLYPPPAGPRWMILPTIAVVSLLVLLGVALVVHRRRGERCAQWFVAGYVMVMLLWGTAAVSEETIDFVRSRISGTLGVAGV
jgi:hypothetical protein